jgi:hypothetical protein
MRLKDLRINQVPFWYQTYLGEVDELDEEGHRTGDTVKHYSNPIKAYARVSPNVGQAESNPFGSLTDYDKSISTVVRLEIDEYSKLFIDVEPVIGEDGTTDTEPDYYCVAQKHDLQQNVWAIKKIRAVSNEKI